MVQWSLQTHSGNIHLYVFILLSTRWRHADFAPPPVFPCAQVLTVLSSTERPQVSLESDGGLFFQPTALGCRSTRSWRIRNESRVPLSFRWSVRDSEDSWLSVDPEDGVLQPNESLVRGVRSLNREGIQKDSP